MRIASGHRLAWLTAGLLAFGLSGYVGAADEQAPATKEADTRLYKALADIANQGADLYNNGDRHGCYQLFRGALMTLRLQMADRPDTVKMIDNGLASAETLPTAGHRAFALREVLLNVRTQVGPAKEAAGEKIPMPGEKVEEKPPVKKEEEKVEEKPPVKKEEEKPAARTLWDRLGGEKGVAKIVDDFTDLAKDDPKVNFDRGGKIKLDDKKIAAFKKNLVAFIGSATGGPIGYAGKGMKEVHKGFGVSNDEYDAAAELFKKAMEANEVKKEDVEAVMKVIEDLRKDIVEEKKSEEKPVEKKPVEKKPAPKKPADEEPTDEPKPAEKKPAEKKPGMEKKPAGEEPSEEPKPDEMAPGKKSEDKKPEKKDEEPLR